MIYQECISCGERYGIDENVYACKGCASLLELKYDYGVLGEKIKNSDYTKLPLSVWRYKDFLPVPDSEIGVTKPLLALPTTRVPGAL
jgi:threonine synthase